MLTVVIPYRDNRAGLERLLASLPARLSIVVIDDCSEQPLEPIQGVNVRRLEERGYFSGAVNEGLGWGAELAGKPTDFLVLNQDVWFEDTTWVQHMQNAQLGDEAIIGDGVMNHPAWPNGYVQGTCMWINYNAYLDVGGLDEKHWPLWGATAEWQLRACRKGWEASPIEVPGLIHDRRGGYGSAIQKLLEEQPNRRSLFIRTPPLVSVVTSCWNYGRFLDDWLASLIGGESSLGDMPGQTFRGFEIIICDDNSDDGSWEKIKAVADPWKGIRAVRKSSKTGTAAALNTAIRQAYGKYIMCVDIDDMLAPNALEVFFEHIEKDQSKLFYSDQRRFNEQGLGSIIRTREYNFAELIERNMVPSGTMFAKQSWREAGGYPEAFANGRQDWAFAVAMGTKNHCGERIPQALYYYRRQDHNRSLTNTSRTHHTRFRMMMEQEFPAIYGGNMAGCCGGRNSLVTRALSDVPIVPGAEGMVLMTYTGENVGRNTIKGPVTGIRYVCKASRPTFYCDQRDVPGLLNYMQNKEYVLDVVANVQGKDPQTVEEELESA